MKHLVAMLAALALAVLAMAGLAGPASAHTKVWDATCEGLTLSLDNYQYTAGTDGIETTYKTEIVTPAVPTHDETIAGKWKNFSPNLQNKRFTGPPTYPNDSRGTWHNHGQLPPGQAGDDGVYQNGHGNSSWFYRQAATVVHHIEVPAVTRQVVDHQGTEGTPEKVNHVKVMMNGVAQVDQDFHTTFYHSWAFPQDGTSSTWSIVVTAWDDSQYNLNESGTVGPCPEVAPSQEATASITPNPPTCTGTGLLTTSADGAHIIAPQSGQPDASAGTHTATFQSDAGHLFSNGTNRFDVTYTVLPQLKCPVPVTPVVTPSTQCDVPGTAVPAKTEGITYTPSGLLDARTVTATADEGYELAEGATSVFGPFDLTAATCPLPLVSPPVVSAPVVSPPVVSPPVVSPPVVSPPVVSPPVVSPPVVSPPVVSAPSVIHHAPPVTHAAAQAPAGVLPNTGGPSGAYAALALFLLAGGSVLLLWRRRQA